MPSVSKREWTHKGVTKTAWAVRYVDAKGRRRSRQFERKKEADAYRRQVEREIEDGTHIPRGESVPVSEVCEHFLRHCEDRKRMGAIGRGRYDTLKIDIDRSIIPHLGAMLIADMTPLQVEKWAFAMMRVDGLNPRTAKDRVQTLKLIEKFAVSRGYSGKANVGQALEALRGIPRAKVRTFTTVEVQHLLAIVEARGAHKHRASAMVRCFVNLAAFCGLRYGEIVGLTIANVDLKRLVIRVRHSLPHWDELKGPKTAAGVRDVPMPRHVASLIRAWHVDWYKPNDRQLLFRTATGGRPTGDSLNEMWHALLKRAGLSHEKDPFHFHALRHFAASWMIQNGLSLMDVAGLLGHEKFDTTLQVYAHPIMNKADYHEKFEAISAQLRPPSPVLDLELLTSAAEPKRRRKRPDHDSQLTQTNLSP